VTFRTLASVAEILLLGRAGSLPSCARTLGGLREDFLQGVGKLTRKKLMLFSKAALVVELPREMQHARTYDLRDNELCLDNLNCSLLCCGSPATFPYEAR
jgi:hypothetical protein